MCFFHRCGCCKDGEALVLSKRLVLLEYGGGLDVWTHSTVGRDSAEKGRRGGWKYVSVLESQMSNATICLCMWVFACTISDMDLQTHKNTRKHLVREVAKEIVKQTNKKCSTNHYLEVVLKPHNIFTILTNTARSLNQLNLRTRSLNKWSLWLLFFFYEPVHKVDWTTLTELTGLFKIQQSPHWIIDLVNTLDRMIQLSDLFNNQRSSHIDSLNRLAWFTNWCVQPRGHDVGGGRDDGFVQTLRIANCRPDLM